MPVFGIAPVIRSAAVCAEELSCQEVCVVADTLAVLNVFASPFEDRVRLIPKFLRNDGRYKLTGFVLEHHPFLRRKEFLLFGEHIHDFDLIADIVPFVLRVRDHVRHRGMGDPFAVEVSIPFLLEQRFDLLHRILICGIQLEQLPHHRRLFFVDHKTLIILSVSEDPAVPENYIFLDGLLMPELDTA